MPRKLLLLERPTLQVELCGEIADAVPLRFACQRHAVSESSVHSWLQQGREARDKRPGKRNKTDKVMLAFLAAFERSVADAVSRNVKLVQIAAKDDWRAAAWYLERVVPEEFGTTAKVSVTTPDGGGVGAVIVLPDNGRGPETPKPPEE